MWRLGATLCALVVMASSQPATAAPGGLRLATQGCGYTRVTVPREIGDDQPGVRFVRSSGDLSVVLLYRDNSPGSAFTAVVLAPKLTARPVPLDPSSPLPAGRYTAVVCGTGRTEVTLTLPGATTWLMPRLRPTTMGHDAAVVTVGTLGAETGTVNVPVRSTTEPGFRLLLFSRMASDGATAVRLCWAPPGTLCSSQPRGVVASFPTVGPSKSHHAVFGMWSAGPVEDGVAEMYSTRTYDTADRSAFAAAWVPAP